MSLIDRIRNYFSPSRQATREASAAPLRSLADLDALLRSTESAPATALVQRAARACFHILPDGDAAHLPVGGSRLGGTPDLAIGASWPSAEGGKLFTFYGQINLDGIADAIEPSPLPSRGLLSIFGGAIDSSFESIEARVVVTPPGTPLLNLSLPDKSFAFADESVENLRPVRIRFEAGLSFPTDSLRFVRALELAAPDADIDALMDGLRAAPASAIGQLLGYAQFSTDDVHSEMYFLEIGRANQDRLEIWERWDAWEEAKKISSRLQNGSIYRPWSAADDDNVRWILANKAAIASGIEKWHSLLWINSNPLMNLWINDADPIYFLAKIDEVGQLDLSAVRAGATQS